MIIAQWTACVMLAVVGLFFAAGLGQTVADKNTFGVKLLIALALLAIAAAIAVRP
jgi:hypothetical protein